MRLINATTMKLESFLDDSTRPKYGILSHTWDAKEVTFQDIQQPDYKVTSIKILGCCAQALKDGLEWVWVDSCCIDKSSSAELSEAINSMFNWYRASDRCYIYLSDVPDETPHVSLHFSSAFCKSHWFKRGWTLQELLAPRYRIFYTNTWTEIGIIKTGDEPSFNRGPLTKDNRNILDSVSYVTHIETQCIVGNIAYQNVSVATRMSWAADRETTRPEDTAYSLFGLFDVNLPLLYGEGGERAFFRLQDEILRTSEDQTLLAWSCDDRNFVHPRRCSRPERYSWPRRLFAVSPSEFSRDVDLHYHRTQNSGLVSGRGGGSHHFMTNKGLRINMPVIPVPDLIGFPATHYGLLAVHVGLSLYWGPDKHSREHRAIAIPLCSIEGQQNVYFRCADVPPVELAISLFESPMSRLDGIYINYDHFSSHTNNFHTNNCRTYEGSLSRLGRDQPDAAAVAFGRFFPPYIPPRCEPVSLFPELKEFYMVRSVKLCNGMTVQAAQPKSRFIRSDIPGQIFARYGINSQVHTMRYSRTIRRIDAEFIVRAQYDDLDEYLAALAHNIPRRDPEQPVPEIQIGLKQGEGRMKRRAARLRVPERLLYASSSHHQPLLEMMLRIECQGGDVMLPYERELLRPNLDDGERPTWEETVSVTVDTTKYEELKGRPPSSVELDAEEMRWTFRGGVSQAEDTSSSSSADGESDSQEEGLDTPGERSVERRRRHSR